MSRASLAAAIAAALEGSEVGTLTELARRTGLAYSTVHRAARSGVMELRTLERIAEALGTTPAALLAAPAEEVTRG